LIDMFLSLS